MEKTFEKWLEAKGVKFEDVKDDAEKLAGHFNEYNAEAQKALKEAIEGKASKEDIEKLEKSLRESQLEQMKALNEALKEQGIAIKKLNEKEATKNVLGFKDAIKEGLKQNKALISKIKEGTTSEWLSIKAVGDMTIANNISGGNVPVEQRLAGFNDLKDRRLRLLDVVSRGTAESNVISWVYKANRDGAAGGTSEGAAKNQIDFDLVVASETVVKRTAYIKLSTEMLDDIPFIESAIRGELLVELLKDVEAQVYSGNGTAPNMRGIRTVATAFAAGSFANSVDNANKVDVLRVAMDQIRAENQDEPSAILMHPSDVTSLKLEKVSSSDKRYIDALQEIASMGSLDGVPIIQSTLVTKDEYLVGAFSLAFVFDKGEVSIEMGLDGNDFTKNMVTVRAEWRGATIVKNNDRKAFIKGDFSDDAAALETP